MPRLFYAHLVIVLLSACTWKGSARRSAARSKASADALLSIAAADLRCSKDQVILDAEKGFACGCNAAAFYRVICEPGCGWVLARPVGRPALCVTPFVSGTVGRVSVKSIQKAMATRSGELGPIVGPSDVRLELVSGEVAPGCRLVLARWGAGKRENSLSALVLDGSELDTYPARALAKVFSRWFKAEPFPEAWFMASVVAFILGASSEHQVVFLSGGDIEFFAKNPDERKKIRLPEFIQVDGQPGVAFFWKNRYGVSRVRVFLSDQEKLVTEEKFLREL